MTTEFRRRRQPTRDAVTDMSDPQTPHDDPAESFRRLHDDLLVLPNVWDAGSARAVESAGARALATTSAGVAMSFGLDDGEQLDRPSLIDLVARIVSAVGLPVSVDIERGYGETPDDVADTVRAVVRAGAVGFNLEDGEPGGLRRCDEQVRRIAAARSADSGRAAPAFINARVDVYLAGNCSPEKAANETLQRAEAYVEAGADGVFVPGLTDLSVVTWLAERLPVALNVMAGPGGPPVSDFASAGARRVSLGPSVALSAHDHVRRYSRQLLER